MMRQVSARIYPCRKCLKMRGLLAPEPKTHAVQEPEHNFIFLIWKGLNTLRPAMNWGLFKP